MRKEFNSDTLIELIVPVYEKYFSHDEIKELIAFYESPLGKKLVDRMPLMMQESMSLGQEWGQQVAMKMMEKLAEKGYKRM